ISALDRIEKKILFLEANNQFDLVGCSLIAIDVNNKKIGESIYFSNEKLLKERLKLVTPVSHIWVAKKSLYDKLKGYRNISGVEDYDFLLRMNTLGYKYSNLENYFGYYVRLGRVGNTISTYGIRQIKLHSYVYKLYLERQKSGFDTFNLNSLNKNIKTNKYMEKLHYFSSKSLFKGIDARSEKKFFKMTFYVILSMVSPYQIFYLYNKFLNYKIIQKYYK
ncbi:MAG: glycosyltransferase family 2 protein, partial [Lutibacter sp.]|nr:glycosyltransferase family 2 protein [Lutibacter sp.]